MLRPRRDALSPSAFALAKAHEEETGEAPVLDPDFAADLEEIIENREMWNPPAWELILDSSVIISAERRGSGVRQILKQAHASHGEIEIGLSVVTVAELVHGAYRAKTADD
jgi:hypothetical protein